MGELCTKLAVKHLSLWGFMLLLPISAASGSVGLRCPDEEFARYVSHLQMRLGIELQPYSGLGEQGGLALDFLRRHRDVAVPCLVAELRVVTRRRLPAWERPKNWRYEHVLWVLRALRYVTETDFCAPPEDSVHLRWLERQGMVNRNDTRKSLMGMDCTVSGTLAFFGVWQSRDTPYLAPPDVQRRIIAAWRRFAAGKDPGLPRKGVSRYPFASFEDWWSVYG